MCAIFGFVNYRCSLNRSEMKELINRLSVESEVRGKDATGIAYVKHGELKVFKRAKPAHKVKLYVPEDTVTLTGHTRMTTQATPDTFTITTRSQAKLRTGLLLYVTTACFTTTVSLQNLNVCRKAR